MEIKEEKQKLVKEERKGEEVNHLRFCIISLSRQEQVCLMKLHFWRYFSHHQATKKIMSHTSLQIISRNIASVKIFVHDVIQLVYCEH